jgi:hydroxyacyl-ACP dehydratase HTD2-like protein with hotdog domain
MKDKYFVSEWTNEMHGHLLSLLMDDAICLIYKRVVVYLTFRLLSFVAGNCVAYIFVSIQLQLIVSYIMLKTNFYDRAALFV